MHIRTQIIGYEGKPVRPLDHNGSRFKLLFITLPQNTDDYMLFLLFLDICFLINNYILLILYSIKKQKKKLIKLSMSMSVCVSKIFKVKK